MVITNKLRKEVERILFLHNPKCKLHELSCDPVDSQGEEQPRGVFLFDSEGEEQFFVFGGATFKNASAFCLKEYLFERLEEELETNIPYVGPRVRDELHFNWWNLKYNPFDNTIRMVDKGESSEVEITKTDTPRNSGCVYMFKCKDEMPISTPNGIIKAKHEIDIHIQDRKTITLINALIKKQNEVAVC